MYTNYMEEIISKQSAKNLGRTHYFTGKPCKYGHLEKRIVSSGACLECNRQRTQTWRKDNTESARSINKKSYAKHADRRRADKRLDYWSRPEHHRSRKAADYYLRRNHHSERNRGWRARNKDHIKDYRTRYASMNSHVLARNAAKRRAALLAAIPAWYSEFDDFVMREAYELRVLRGIATGIDWHVDHIIPLQAKNACGLHCASNIQVATKLANLKKGNRIE